MLIIRIPTIDQIIKEYNLEKTSEIDEYWAIFINQFELDNEGRDYLFDDGLGWIRQNLGYLNLERDKFVFILLFLVLG